MHTLTNTLGIAALTLASLGLQAEDFQPLMSTAKSTWPEKQHIGVICDFRSSEAEVMALARSAGVGATITVADTRSTEQARSAAALMANYRANFVVLMPHDRAFGDGTLGATLAIKGLARRGVPAVGTTPVALKQGAVFSVGDGTRGALLVTDRLIGTVDVLLPGHKALALKADLQSVNPAGEGMATIQVISAE